MEIEKKKKTKILVLEDRPSTAQGIKKNLESMPNRNWEVQTVKNLSEFKDKVATEQFDLFVLDYDIPKDRELGSTRGGGDKALDVLQNSIGIVPAIMYSGFLKSELAQAQVIKKGASYIIQKGGQGSALSALIERILNEHDEKLGFVLKSYLASRLGEKTFYMDLICEEKQTIKGEERRIINVEVQRLFDPKPIVYIIHLNKNGEIVHAEQKKA